MNISEGEHFMKKTKIICTLGPSTDKKELLVDMIRSGMDLARFNFSHGSHSECEARLNLLKEAEKEAGRLVGYVADTKGPEMRLGLFKGDKTTLVPGHEFILTTEDVEGTAEKAHVNYAGLPEEVKRGDTILLNDGKLSLEVQSTTDKEIHTIVVNGGEISSRKRVAVPGAFLKLPFLSDADISDITFAAQHGMTYVAASFVRNAHDAMEIRRLLEKLGSPMGIIAKIENQEGVDNIDDILQVVDGVMVARGDLGVEIPMEDVPIVQKEIIAKCNALGKPVVTATQMLESMITNYRATRAEANDIANSIFDGTDAIMLSGETASGAYPLEAVQTMARIAKRTEDAIDYVTVFKHKGIGAQVQMTDAISHATVQIAQELEANAILSITESAHTGPSGGQIPPQSPCAGGFSQRGKPAADEPVLGRDPAQRGKQGQHRCADRSLPEKCPGCRADQKRRFPGGHRRHERGKGGQHQPDPGGQCGPENRLQTGHREESRQRHRPAGGKESGSGAVQARDDPGRGGSGK